jgi:predicted ATPase
MGLHTGPAEPAGADYATTHTLNRVARIMAAGHGGQIVLSVEVAELLHGYLPPDSSLRDLGQHRMKGMTQREHLFQLLAPGLPAGFPPLATLDAVPNNLPVQLSSFVGREQEITHLQQLIQPAQAAGLVQRGRGDEVRLLTLTGPGGTGKTRLSLQVAARVLEAFPDGAWLVELAPLADPALVAQSLAGTLGVREQPERALFEVLADYLRAKHLLLILDNCEHLIGACAEAADRLLHAATGVKILASSREALGIAGETTFRVPSLPSPAADSALSLEALGQFEAVRLFVARAQLALPSFALTQQNMLAVAQVCRRLDGIPLALELAAARVKLLRAEQIAARLDDSFRLLTSGSRTALPRQHTLRALIDWSYDLLTEPERALLRRLSVFAGGWTLESAEAICSDLDVLDLLTRLVDKSLVVADQAPGDETRYRLLETIRQYARDKLFDAPGGESAAARDRHLAYYLPLAEEAAPRLFGPDESWWLERLATEQDNLRAALEWALDREPEAALRLGGALHWFWEQHGDTSEANAALTKALAQVPTLPEPRDEAGHRRHELAHAKALGGLAATHMNFGDFMSARSLLEQSTDLFRRWGESSWLVFGLAALAMATAITGDQPAAAAAAAESQAMTRAAGEPLALASALLWLGEYEGMTRGDLAVAQAELAESVRLYRQLGSAWGTALSLLSWGRVANADGDTAAARRLVEESLPMFLERRDLRRANMARSELAHIERHEGHVAQAQALYRQTIVAWEELGNRGAMAHQLECLAFLARAEGQGERAARLLGAAEAARAVASSPMWPDQQQEYDRELAALRAQLDAAALAREWEAGQALTLDEAVKYALAEGSESTAPGRSP